MSNRIMVASLVAALAAAVGASAAGAASKPDHVRDAEWARSVLKTQADAAAQTEQAALARKWAQWDQAHGGQWARGVAQAEARVAAAAREEQVLRWAQRERARLAAEAHAQAVYKANVKRWSHYDGVKHFADAKARRVKKLRSTYDAAQFGPAEPTYPVAPQTEYPYTSAAPVAPPADSVPGGHGGT